VKYYNVAVSKSYYPFYRKFIGVISLQNGKVNLLDWLHFKREIDFTQARGLGSAVGAILLIVFLFLIVISVVGLFFLFGAFVGFGPFSGGSDGASIRNIGLVLAATIGFPFVVWRSIVAQKQADTAEQGQITDRINKAVEGLGSEKIVKEIIEIPRYQKHNEVWIKDESGNPVPALGPDGKEIVDRTSYERTIPNLEVRIGSIYALERIAQDSFRDHINIMEILCAYIRGNSPAISLDPTEPPFSRPVPRTDVQAALSVIGRRSKEQIELEWKKKFRLDFRNSDLSGADFMDGNYSAAMFHECRLEAARANSDQLEPYPEFRK
jgi:hypothetical protein